ncbi:LysR family transcriptional regulator [Rhodovulum sulfidophilum]|uniref:LysR family transcriptional regulator n=1 Tax=Rhodovulum sulfidophilum TaxID=35806 RepID=A0ABS1RZ42_RHOSU|nr:LysR family transcriptional regulator [Rhodovulum sulfidophilum]MBL3610355.1 LysR family transcriptional regulator [Rhodovulum sulfidophilum]MCE8419862.1 LysR family transcriptional regulator [Rhodovulum sulfidophilum]MCE8455046.1 LysR family transcriptional regulator [Rhodovulum sulfidophilum]
MIDKLEMFIVLARERHFGRAAEACGVTQPTLSAAIKQLEEQLDVLLVWRGSRFGGLTPEGARVLERARVIVADARALREEMRAVKRGLSGDLRLAAVPTALAAITALTGPLTLRHPNLRITIFSRNSTEIVQMLDDLQVDAGLTYLENEPLGRVATVPLYAEHYTLVMRADHPLAGRAAVPWAEAAAEPLCLLSPDMQNRRIVDRHMAEAGAVASARLESNSLLALIAHVQASGWVTILPLRTAQPFLGAGSLVAVPLTEPEAEHVVGLIAPHREPMTPVLDALMEAARQAKFQ